eukprot:scaffold35698_cov63-Attheya_sp.AAC.17
MAHMEPHPAREWIQMTPMDIITDDGSYGTTPSQEMDPDDTNGHRSCGILFYCLLATVHVSSRSRMTAHMEPHPAREWIQMRPMDIYCTCLIQITDDGSYGTTQPGNGSRWRQWPSLISRMTAHMEPHPAREWIQMTPMDIVNVELLLYCLATHTVHVSSRSQMTAHMWNHPAREWI